MRCLCQCVPRLLIFCCFLHKKLVNVYHSFTVCLQLKPDPHYEISNAKAVLDICWRCAAWMHSGPFDLLPRFVGLYGTATRKPSRTCCNPQFMSVRFVVAIRLSLCGPISTAECWRNCMDKRSVRIRSPARGFVQVWPTLDRRGFLVLFTKCSSKDRTVERTISREKTKFSITYSVYFSARCVSHPMITKHHEAILLIEISSITINTPFPMRQ